MSWCITGYDRFLGEISSLDCVEYEPPVTVYGLLKAVCARYDVVEIARLNEFCRDRLYADCRQALAMSVGCNGPSANFVISRLVDFFFGIYHDQADLYLRNELYFNPIERTREYIKHMESARQDSNL